MRQLIKKHFITLRDAVGVHMPLYIVLGIMIVFTGISLWLPHLLKQNVENAQALSLSVGTETVVAQVPTDSKIKMLYANQTYYLMFSSTTNDGSAHNLYITTSTNGTTWSSSTEIYSLINNGERNNSPASFDFSYNPVGNYFGMLVVPSSTLPHLAFASSSNAFNWSATTTVDATEALSAEDTYSSGRPFLTFATNTSYTAIVYERHTSATTTLIFGRSTNDGVSFVTNTIITDLTPGAQGRLAGVALHNRSGVANTIHVAYTTGNENAEPIEPVSLVYASSTDNGSTFVSTVIDTNLQSSGGPLVFGPLGEASLAVDDYGRAGIVYQDLGIQSCSGGCTLAGSIMYGLQDADTLEWSTTTVHNFSGAASGQSMSDIDMSFDFYSGDAPLFAYAPYDNEYSAYIGVNTSTPTDVSGVVTSTAGTSAINVTVAGQISMVYATNTQKVAVAYISGNSLMVPITTLLDPDITLVRPELSSASLPDATQSVPVDARLEFNFDSSLDPNTAIADNVTLQANSGNTQGGTPSGTNLCDTIRILSGDGGSNSRIICDHLTDQSPLTTSTWYTVTLDTGITNTTGVALAANITRTFQTGSFTPSDNQTVPTVMSSYPAPGNQISINSNLEVKFSAAMAITGAGSVTSTSNIILRTSSYGQPTGDNICDGEGCTLSYDSSLKKLTINPASNLSANTEYMLVVSGQTTNGIALSPSTYFVGFRTTASADTVAPTVSGISPASSTTGVILNLSAVDISFSEAMSESTIVSSAIQFFKDANSNFIMDAGEQVATSSLSVSYDSFSNSAHIGISNLLTQNSTYCIKLLGSMTDVNGNALSSVLRCFTTVNSAYSASAPTVLSMDADNYSVWIQFDQPLASDGTPTSTDSITLNLINEAGSSISQIDLSGASVSIAYRSEANSIEITGLALTTDQTIKATITGVSEKSGAQTIVNNGTTNVAKAKILNAVNTGGVIGGFNTQSFDKKDFGLFWENPERCSPEVRFVSSTSRYRCEFPAPAALTTGAQVIITFPAGTTVTNAYLTASSTSFTNADLNGPAGSGTPYAVSTSTSSVARTFSFNINGSVAANDQLEIEIAGIQNAPTVGEKTVTAVVKDANGIKVGQTIQFAPYMLSEGGALSVSGTVCKGSSSGGSCDVAGDDSAISGATVFLESFGSFGSGGTMGGRQEATTDASGNYTFRNLSSGQYGVGVFIHPDVSDFDGVSGGKGFQDVNVSGSSVTDRDFRFQDISSSGGQTLTVSITGGPASEQVDVFCFAPGNASFSAPIMKPVTLSGVGAGSTTLSLVQNTIYECGMGPHIPFESLAAGGPPPIPNFTFMPPQPQVVNVVEADLSISFALKTAGKQIKGIVTDASSTGIANVFINAHPSSGEGIDTDGSPVPMSGSFAKSKSDGTFTINVINGTYKIGACAPGLPCSSEYEVTVRDQDNSVDSNNSADVYSNGTLLTGNGLTIKMAKGSLTIAGAVKDENGSAIKYAFVDAQRVGASDTCTSFTPQGGFTGSPTDSDGNYTLYVAAGTYRIAAFAPSYGEVSCSVVTVDASSLTGINLQATAADYATISGTVTKGGTASSGAFVNCSGSSGFNHTGSGSDGTFSMKVKAGTYTCEGFLPGSGPLTASTGQFTVAAEGTQTVNFTMGNPGTVQITLSANVTNAFCDVRNSSGNGNGTGQANSSGVYTVKVPAGTYTVRCGHPSMGEIGLSTATVTAGGTTSVTLTPPTLYTISGRITDGSSNIESAVLTLVDKDNGRIIPFSSDGTTGTSNNVSASIPAGNYSVTASKSGYVDSATPETLAVSSNTTFTTRALTQASALVSVTVQASGSNYTGNANVVATRSDGRVAVAQVDTAVTSGSNATLRLTDGTWSVTGYGDNGKSPSSATTITVVDDTPNSSSFTMSLGTAITGYTAAEKKQQSMVPSNGGLFKDSNIGSGFELNIPTGALSTSDSSSGSIQTQKAPMFAIDTPGKKFIGNAAIEITPKDSSGKAITSLASSGQTATIKLPYTEADVTAAGVEESNLVAAVWNDTAGDWETLSSVVDTENNVIIAQATHFSTFGVVGSNSGGSTSSGSSGSSSSSAGGGVSVGVAPPTVPTESQEATGKVKAKLTYKLNTPTPLSVGASEHTITILSATSDRAQVKIESDPVMVWVDKDKKRDVDTNQDGIDDLRVLYLGLEEKDAVVEFSNLTDEGELTRAFTINKGAFYTDSRTVTLLFNVNDAKWAAISHDKEFKGGSYEPIVASSTTWILTPGDGEKTVYIRFRSEAGGVLEITDTITLMNQGFKQETDCALEKNKPYMDRTSPAVYYITKQCTKRPFLSSQKYFSYFNTWKDIIIVNKAELEAIPNDTLGFMPWGVNYNPKYGAIVKNVVDPKTYLLLDGKKYWITSESTLSGLGYSMDWIEDIDEALLDKYPEGGEITDISVHVDGTIVKYGTAPEVYKIEEGKKRHIKDEATFERLGYRWDRIVTISEIEVYPDGEIIE